MASPKHTSSTTLILTPEIQIPGLPEAMNAAMHTFIFYWREKGQLPTIEGLYPNLSATSHHVHPQMPQPLLSRASFFDGASHAMDFAGRVWVQTGKIP
jgi:hypothetical protein